MVTVLVATCEQCGRAETRAEVFPGEPRIGYEDGWVVVPKSDVDNLAADGRRGVRPRRGGSYAWCSFGCLESWWKANARKGNTLTVQTPSGSQVVGR